MEKYVYLNEVKQLWNLKFEGHVHNFVPECVEMSQISAWHLL